MAHDPSRTESATPKRREKAREEGSILRVPDMDSTLLMWGNLFLFMGLWGSTFVLLGSQMSQLLARTGEPGLLTEGNLGKLAQDLFLGILRILLPFLGINLLLALAIQFAQHGFKPTFKRLQPKLNRMDPSNGLKRLFSARSMVELLKSLVKLLIIIGVAAMVLGPRIPLVMVTMKQPLATAMVFLQDTLFVLYRNVMIAMLLLALADFLYQRHAHEKSLRMTKQEVKEEAKDSEGSPEIKGRQKSLMLAAAMRRIQIQVPKASVVITNPTHFAVALKYEEGTAAPIVVAKGVDHLALKIREKAKASGVIIVENPPLARAIYRQVKLDKPIPPELYQAVAQVLAYVYRLRAA